jgi:creatinine amidohydrolase
MKARPYILQEINYQFVQQTDYEIAVLPWGATEAHNYHLPYGTDNIQNEYIAAESAKKAWESGTKVVVLPNMPFGANCQQLDIPLTINMNPSTQYAVLRDVLDGLFDQGIRKFILFNGHGGNDFKQMIRELKIEYPEMFIAQLNWYRVITDWKEYFEDAGDHAGEMETSIMMKIVKDWVLPIDQAGDGNSKKLKFEGRHEGWLWSPREWTRVTKDTGIGNPEKASEVKGEKALQFIISKIAHFFIALGKTDPEDIYE